MEQTTKKSFSKYLFIRKYND